MTGIKKKMSIINKLSYIFDRKQKIRFGFLVVIIAIGSLLELLGVAAIMPLVDVVTNPSKIHSDKVYSAIFEKVNLDNDKQFIMLFIFALIAIYIVKNVYLIFMYDCQYRYTYNNHRRVAMSLMECYMSQSYLFHLSKNVSELQRNMREDVEMLFSAVLSVVQLISELLTCALLGGYLIVIDKTVSFSVIFLLGIFTITFLRFAKKKSTSFGGIFRKASVDLNKWVRQSFEGIKEIKVSNKEDTYIKIVDGLYKTKTTSQRRQNVLNVLPRPIFEAICVSSLLLVVGIKIAYGVDLQYFIPVLSAFAIAAFRLLPSFGRLTGYINNISYNKSAVDNVYGDLKEVEELKKKNLDRFEDKSEISFKKEIIINNISFTYPNTTRKILDDASLTITKDKSIAFIGASGSGKTTLADIVLGLLEPQNGIISVDGVNINDKPYGWHKLLGYIPQSIYLIDDTIRNNVLFGFQDDDDSKVWKALESAQLAEFVKSLDDGLDTIVGERGVRLSGGQRQRIGIARALYSEPEVLVLDEATSALDNETETAVMEAIDNLKGSRTMIIIAHRLTTIRNCDEVYEVGDGKIIKRDIQEVIPS